MSSLCVGSCIRTIHDCNKILTQGSDRQKRVILLYDFRGSSPRLGRPNGFGFRAEASTWGKCLSKQACTLRAGSKKRLSSYSPFRRNTLSIFTFQRSLVPPKEAFWWLGTWETYPNHSRHDCICVHGPCSKPMKSPLVTALGVSLHPCISVLSRVSCTDRHVYGIWISV